MGRIALSFQLVRQSYQVLMRDKELMVLPLISGAIMAVVTIGAGLGFDWVVGSWTRAAGAVSADLPDTSCMHAIGIFFRRRSSPAPRSACAAAIRRCVRHWRRRAGGLDRL